MDVISGSITLIAAVIQRCALVKKNQQEATALQTRLRRLDVCLKALPDSYVPLPELQSALDSVVKRADAVITTCESPSLFAAAFKASSIAAEFSRVQHDIGAILQELQIQLAGQMGSKMASVRAAISRVARAKYSSQDVRRICKEVVAELDRNPLSQDMKEDGDDADDTELIQSNILIPFKQLQLGREIGAGTFAHVWLAEYLGAQVAVKGARIGESEMGCSFGRNQDLMNEAAMHVALRHPNVVQLLGVSLDDDDVYLVMEYLPNNLFQLLRNGALSLTQRLALALHVSAGLNFLHSQDPPIFHRDLKSLNVLVDATLNHAKLCDFGLALFKKKIRSILNSGKSVAIPSAGSELGTSSSHGLVGSFPWMAPEIMRARPYSAAADVFSLGVVLWELLTGQEPWEDAVSCDIIRQEVLAGSRLEFPAAFPPILKALISECWELDPVKRPNIASVHQRLKVAVQELNSRPLKEMLSPRQNADMKSPRGVPPPSNPPPARTSAVTAPAVEKLSVDAAGSPLSPRKQTAPIPKIDPGIQRAADLILRAKKLINPSWFKKPDMLQAAGLLEEAAKLGHPGALILQAQDFEKGRTVEKNVDRALVLYATAFAATHPANQNMPEERAAAIKHGFPLLKALYARTLQAYARGESVQVCNGFLLLLRLVEIARNEEPFVLPSRAYALWGSALACCAETEEDAKLATAYVQRAADAGDDLGRCLVARRDLQDPSKASAAFAVIFELASRRSPLAAAVAIMSRCYRHGWGVTADAAKADQWYNRRIINAPDLQYMAVLSERDPFGVVYHFKSDAHILSSCMLDNGCVAVSRTQGLLQVWSPKRGLVCETTPRGVNLTIVKVCSISSRPGVFVAVYPDSWSLHDATTARTIREVALPGCKVVDVQDAGDGVIVLHDKGKGSRDELVRSFSVDTGAEGARLSAYDPAYAVIGRRRIFVTSGEKVLIWDMAESLSFPAGDAPSIPSRIQFNRPFQLASGARCVMPVTVESSSVVADVKQQLTCTHVLLRNYSQLTLMQLSPFRHCWSVHLPSGYSQDYFPEHYRLVPSRGAITFYYKDDDGWYCWALIRLSDGSVYQTEKGPVKYENQFSSVAELPDTPGLLIGLYDSHQYASYSQRMGSDYFYGFQIFTLPVGRPMVEQRIIFATKQAVSQASAQANELSKAWRRRLSNRTGVHFLPQGQVLIAVFESVLVLSREVARLSSSPAV